MTILSVLDARQIPHEVRLDAILQKLNSLKTGEGVVLVAPHAPDQLMRKLLKEFPGRYDFSPGSRGPEAWRYHIVARQAGPRTVSGYLAWDHDRLDGIMEIATKLAEQDQWPRAANVLAEFKEGLFRHIDIEEAILFPAFEERTGMRDVGPTAVMRLEHVDIKEAVNDIAAAAKAKSLDDFESAKGRLLGVLVEHNMKEEQVIYPGVDQMLDGASREQLVEKLLLG
ncbi:MAG: hemerythrin domain-containing protein [Planctomycetes bacterium]|nr:hemerythrin domain-containing protein [Planctomycetota bacterium]